MGGTVTTLLRLRNLSTSDVLSIHAYEIDPFDFGPTHRPDIQFEGTSLPAKTCLERTLDVKRIANNCPFTMKLIFDDDSEDVFRIHYKHAADDTEPQFRHITKTHRIRYAKKAQRILEIVIEDTDQQLENHQAEQLNEEACRLEEAERYDEAAAKFVEANRKATKPSTINKICTNYEKLQELKTATRLNDQGLQLLNANKFDAALQTFQDALTIASKPDTVKMLESNLEAAKSARTNRDAKKLNQEGLQLKRSGDNDGALLKFDEALRLTTDAQLLGSIKTHKSETLHNLGTQRLANAWSLDNEATDESIDEFSKAKYLFQLADSVKTRPESADSVVLIDCKLEGCKCYSSGAQLESEAMRLDDDKEAAAKLQEARMQYTAAFDKYESGYRKGEGDSNFSRGLLLATEAIQRVEYELNKLGAGV